MDCLMPTGGIGKKMEPTHAFRIISDTCIPQHTHLALHYASRLPRTRSLGNGWSHIFTVMSHLRSFLFFYHHSVVANHDFSSRDEGLQTPPESLGSIHRRAHSSMCCRCEGPKTMMQISSTLQLDIALYHKRESDFPARRVKVTIDHSFHSHKEPPKH